VVERAAADQGVGVIAAVHVDMAGGVARAVDVQVGNLVGIGAVGMSLATRDHSIKVRKDGVWLEVRPVARNEPALLGGLASSTCGRPR